MKEKKIRNLKITAHLISPLIGAPPFLDALLTYVLAFKLDNFESQKMNKSTPINQFKRLPIPITQYDLGNYKINACSDPIYKIESEWEEKITKRFETDKLSLIINPEKRKTISIGGGYLRSKFIGIYAKIITQIIWFARGEQTELERLLNNVNSIGYFRKIGYGLVDRWIVEEHAPTNFIFSKEKLNDKKILMKTIPICKDIKDIIGCKKSFGAYKPPYWHPGNFMEIFSPC